MEQPEMISADRESLKHLSSFNVDAQFFQQYGTQLFGYQGEKTPQYQQLCAGFKSILDDISTQLEALKSKI